MYSTHEVSPGHLERLEALGATVIVARDEPGAIKAAGDANVVLGHRYLRQVLPHAPRLRWVQSTAGGTDRLPLASLRSRGVTITRFSAASPTIARHAVTLAWSLTRSVPDFVRQQDERRWEPPAEWLPAPRRALVLGAGAIGSAIAQRLQPDGIRVWGVRRSGSSVPAGFDALLPPDAWMAELPRVDWLFLALPLTEETTCLVGEPELSSLPTHALVVNVSRGETLDTGALCRALRRGHLGGAALDVVAPKPSGPEDPVWRTPRLLITPHVSSHHAGRASLVESFCESQVRRFVAGEPLLDVVR